MRDLNMLSIDIRHGTLHTICRGRIPVKRVKTCVLPSKARVPARRSGIIPFETRRVSLPWSYHAMATWVVPGQNQNGGALRPLPWQQ